jgi:hypothetical protein
MELRQSSHGPVVHSMTVNTGKARQKKERAGEVPALFLLTVNRDDTYAAFLSCFCLTFAQRAL